VIDFAHVITANDSVEAVVIGTKAEADAVCLRLKTEKITADRQHLGDLADHLIAPVHWAVRKTRILSK
jgi:hypothetical protein